MSKAFAEILPIVVAILLLVSEIWKLRALKGRLRESLGVKFANNALEEVTRIGTMSSTWTHLTLQTESITLTALLGPVLAAIGHNLPEMAAAYILVFVVVLVFAGLFSFCIGPLDIENKRGIIGMRLTTGVWLIIFQVVVIVASGVMWAIVVF